tara:strand:- start:1992 stop:2222 length:231 start_codon:yes stop_codon:yes gene_type:complete
MKIQANPNATNSEMDAKVIITPDYTVDKGEIISELLTLTALLDGKMERLETCNSVGRTSKKIVIEYDIKERDQRSS